MEFVLGVITGVVLGFIWGWNLYHKRVTRRLFTLLQDHDFREATIKVMGK